MHMYLQSTHVIFAFALGKSNVMHQEDYCIDLFPLTTLKDALQVGGQKKANFSLAQVTRKLFADIKA